MQGRAWHSGRSKDFAVPAEMFLAAGAHYVVPDFAWVQDVGGSSMVLAGQDGQHAILIERTLFDKGRREYLYLAARKG